jgi:hypothetical protein
LIFLAIVGILQQGASWAGKQQKLVGDDYHHSPDKEDYATMKWFARIGSYLFMGAFILGLVLALSMVGNPDYYAIKLLIRLIP